MTATLDPVPARNTDVPATCGACPALACNLCDGLAALAAAPDAQGGAPQEHAVPARRQIWRKGETVPGVPVICQGWATTAITMSDGRRQILSCLLPGDLVSAVLVQDSVIQCSVEAVTDVRYRIFPRGSMQAALATRPDLLDVVSRLWSDEAMRANRLSIDLGRRAAAERIANLILNLSERLAQRGMMRERTLDFPLRQHHIADAVGLTVVHVGNVLSEFRRAGLVEIGDRALTIRDEAALRRIAEAA